MSDLSKKAVLVKLTVSQWSGRKEDAMVSREVCASHGAEHGSGEFLKRIVPKSSLLPIQQSASRLYVSHKTVTLPWLNDGTRILKAEAFDRYTATIDAEKAVFTSAVENFLEEYDSLKYESQRRLGSLYDPRDWPTRDTMRGKFGVDTRVYPMPSIGDFRQEIFNHIPPAARQEIIDKAKADEAAIHTACLQDVFQRMKVVVTALGEKLREYGGDSKKRMHDSIVGNITNLVDLLPALNITDDPRITALGNDMAANLACYSADTLKYSEHARLAAVKAADAFVDKMAAFGF